MAVTIPQFPSSLASGCLLSPMSRSSSSGFPAAVTRISAVSARLKRRGNSSTPQEADDGGCLLHSRPAVIFGDLQGPNRMSAHGPMPKSAWIFPALAVILFAVATALGTDVHAVGRWIAFCSGVAVDPVRHRVCRRASCRGDRRADRRALRHAAADARGHHHRGRADRHHHARRQAGAGIGARHRVCGGDDRVQRPRRPLHLHRRPALPRAGFSGLGRQPLSQRAVRAGDDHADHAELYADGAGADLFGGAARLRQRGHPHSLCRVSLYPDHPASRLFHQPGRRRGGRRIAAVQPDAGAQHRVVALSRYWRWCCWPRNFR